MKSSSLFACFGLAAVLAAMIPLPKAFADEPNVLVSQEYSQSEGLPRFPDFGFMLPAGTYTGRTFVLSQNYPEVQPEMDDGVKKILAIDFKKDWRAYLEAVREYVFEGNVNHPGGVENDFFLEDNHVRNWYHVPWQHWGTTGREGYHGLTQEGPIAVKMLAQTQLQTSHAYAVGFYNDLGGYTIGRVWKDADNPDIDYIQNGGAFPIGTVVAKILFTTIDASQVPYLKNPVSWNAYVYAYDVDPSIPTTDATRVTAKVHLIQMDIMVRDPRAKDTGGWVFGNFMYNGDMNKDNRWYNLVPVGIMWGNDHDVRINLSNPQPTETKLNPLLKEQIINTSSELPATHLGWGYRLNGPVDNPLSSCMSCHSTAEYPEVSAIMPFLNTPPVNPPEQQGAPASEAWMRWFRNVPCGDPFDPGKAVSLDYSLQLAKSVQNFIEYKNQTEAGLYSIQYWEDGHKFARGTKIVPPEDPTPAPAEDSQPAVSATATQGAAP